MVSLTATAMAKYCYALLGLLSSVALAAAFLPSHYIRSRQNHGNVSQNAHPLTTKAQIIFSARSPSHCIRQKFTQTLASASDDGVDIKDDSTVTGVTLKMAFDSSPVWGVADLSETKSERFTSPESLDMVHRLRRESSAVLVGRGTVDYDDCSLTVRRVELGDGQVQPTRVVLDPSLSLIGKDYTILKNGIPTIIYYSKTEETEDISKGETCDSVTLVGLDQSDTSGTSSFSISPSKVVKDLADRGLQHIMVEGGPATARAFLQAGVVDRAILVRAPIEFEIPVPAQMDENALKSAGLKMLGTSTMGGDTVEYWTQDGMPWPDSELSMWP